YLDYPAGANLTWSGLFPLPALILSPLTLWLGPVVSYNLLATLALALSAWTGFLAVRRYVPSAAAATIGGLLYGFSPALVAHALGGTSRRSIPRPTAGGGRVAAAGQRLCQRPHQLHRSHQPAAVRPAAGGCHQRPVFRHAFGMERLHGPSAARAARAGRDDLSTPAHHAAQRAPHRAVFAALIGGHGPYRRPGDSNSGRTPRHNLRQRSSLGSAAATALHFRRHLGRPGDCPRCQQSPTGAADAVRLPVRRHPPGRAGRRGEPLGGQTTQSADAGGGCRGPGVAPTALAFPRHTTRDAPVFQRANGRRRSGWCRGAGGALQP